MFAQVAVDIPVFDTLTYAVPDELKAELRVGQLIQVPFRHQARVGLLIELTTELADPSLAKKLRPILDIVDRDPLVNPEDIRFLQFVSEYYMSPIGDVVKTAIPSAVRVLGMKHYVASETPAPWDDIDETLADALRLLEGGERSVRSLADELSVTLTRLSELERLNLVQVLYRDQDKVTAKKERYYRQVSQPVKRLGSKQAEIIEVLSGQDRVALSELRARVPSPHSSLKSLVGKGVLETWEEEIYRDPFRDVVPKPPGEFTLTEAQRVAYETILQPVNAGTFQSFLLHGVTGSGKTEVYARVIKRVRDQGKRALVLLPEIALTPQFVSVFSGHFGDDVAVLHSGLSQAEKFDQWRRIRRNEAGIVIGARSAIFAPIKDLGIVIVDEEHDPSFKQEEGTRYNARDLALMRGKLSKAVVVLGSATPSLESYQNANLGRSTYLRLANRAGGGELPKVEIVDMRSAERKEGIEAALSPPLKEAIESAFMAGQQTILFLNRRGFSPCVICDACGHVWRCPDCDVSLTYHRSQESLRCHHCDHSVRLPERCPECSAEGVGPRGFGTEQLETIIGGEFPRQRVARLDRDTGSGRGLREIIRRFGEGAVDLLIGTQMVTKGHDFPGVTVVGVVQADQSLNFPDFRSAERTFQLLSQVAGRAGRGGEPGRVWIQSFEPSHYSLTTALNHDYDGFASKELTVRKELRYPPFSHMVAVRFEAASDAAVFQAARDYAFTARRIARRQSPKFDGVLIVGPAIAPIERLRGRTRFQLIIRAENRQAVRELVLRVLDANDYFAPARTRHKNVRIVVDVDPVNLL